MVKGKYFYIESKMCNLVADIEGESREPGTRVTTWHRKNPSEAHNQLWYRDGATGTIRSKMHDFCLDVSGNDIVVNPYSPGDNNQQWNISSDNIRLDDGRAMDIAENNSDPGAKLIAWEYHGNTNQDWNIEFIMTRYFYIRSLMNNKVLDVEDNCTDPGTKVIMWTQHGEMQENQLWYEAEDGTIRSKICELCLDLTNDDQLQLGEPGANPQAQVFHLTEEGRIVSKFNPGRCLDIKGADGGDGAEICFYDQHDDDNQKWAFDYV